jgi:hypothetical protein
MGAIPLPQPGQPLDVNYLFDVVNQVNNLTNTVAVRSTSTSRVNTNSDTTGNLKFYAETKNITITNTSGNAIETFFFNYPEFKFAPVVTITVVNNTGSTAGSNVIPTLRTVGTARCEGVVRLNVSGDINISINMIAVGIAP